MVKTQPDHRIESEPDSAQLKDTKHAVTKPGCAPDESSTSQYDKSVTIQETTHYGEVLKTTRQARDLSIEEISQHTKIKQVFLTALEDGDFDQLPAIVFVQGFVKIYAQFLELDQDQILKLLQQNYEEKCNQTQHCQVTAHPNLALSSPDILTQSASPSKNNSGNIIMPLAAIILIAIFALWSFIALINNNRASPAPTPQAALPVKALAKPPSKTLEPDDRLVQIKSDNAKIEPFTSTVPTTKDNLDLASPSQTITPQITNSEPSVTDLINNQAQNALTAQSVQTQAAQNTPIAEKQETKKPIVEPENDRADNRTQSTPRAQISDINTPLVKTVEIIKPAGRRQITPKKLPLIVNIQSNSQTTSTRQETIREDDKEIKIITFDGRSIKEPLQEVVTTTGTNTGTDPEKKPRTGLSDNVISPFSDPIVSDKKEVNYPDIKDISATSATSSIIPQQDIIYTKATIAKKVAPIYPERCRRQANANEKVTVHFDLDFTGNIANPRIDPNSKRCFHKATLKAITQWRYNPRLENGRPVVRENMKITLNFQK